MLLWSQLRRLIRVGQLTIVDAYGHTHILTGSAEPRVTVRLHDPSLHWRLLLFPDLAFGEAYMNGALTFEEGDLYAFLDLYGRNAEVAGKDAHRGMLALLHRQLRWFHQFNPARRARRNAAHHYDLSDELYCAFLDPDRQYSCAYFNNPLDTLEAAQQQKMRHVTRKLLLRPGMTVLDIGCGWGGLALYLARNAMVRVTGITLSERQLEHAKVRARREGLEGQVSFRLEDYREVSGRFDRIVSVGMFEHVGVRYYGEFFGAVVDRLAEDGVALLHTIGSADPPSSTYPWLRKYIFPGAYTPSLSELVSAVENTRLWITDIEVWRLHYAETLRRWRQRFLANCGHLAVTHDQRFCRMWEFYLASCEMSFRYLRSVVFQVQLAKSRHAVPQGREYMQDDGGGTLLAGELWAASEWGRHEPAARPGRGVAAADDRGAASAN